MSKRFDLIVMGGGPAGQKAAIEAGKLGKRVLLLDDQKRLGGVSVHSGTVPSKTLQEISRFLHRLRQESGQGLRLHAPGNLSLQQITARNQVVIHIEEDLAEDQVARSGVEVVRGRGRFRDPHTIDVDELCGSTSSYSGDYIAICTGSRPRQPPGIPFVPGRIFDSNGVMALRTLPRRLAVVGAGIIGCEYATIFASLGTEIDLFDLNDRVVGWADREISQTLMDSMRLLGIRIHTSDTPEHYDYSGSELRLTTRSGRELVSDQALISGGRFGNVELLNLEAIGLGYSDRSTLDVNEFYQTGIDHIYAAGDVIGRPGLSSTSMYQGMYIARHIFAGETPDFARDELPVGIWTIPEVAWVGPSEEQLKEMGIDYGVGRSDFQENTRAQITGDTRGLIKLLFEKESRRLLAVHIISDRATELLALGQAVVHLGGSVDYFIHHIFNYPTLSGVYKSAALDAVNRYYAGNVEAP